MTVILFLLPLCLPSAGASTVPVAATASAMRAFSAPSFSAALAPLQDEELKAKFKEFQTTLKGKDGEAEAIGMIDEFTKAFRVAQLRIEGIDDELSLDPPEAKQLMLDRKALVKEQKALAAQVYSCFDHKARKDITEANMQMWKAGVFALGQMGTDGADYLWKVFEDKKKKFRKEPDFLGLCLEQIGYTHAYQAYTGELTDLLDHHEYLFIAKAADALAQFGEAPGPLRRGATEHLVKLLAEYYEGTIIDKDDVEAQEKYRKVGRAMMGALEALTGVSQSKPLDWVDWWNDHKKKNDEVWAEA